MLVETKALEKTIELALATPYIVGAVPVSVLVIAKPESGKTHQLKEYELNEGVELQADVTYMGLIDNILPKAKEGRLKTLMVGDLVKVYGRNVNVSKNFFTLLNEAIEEGVAHIAVCGHTDLDYEPPARFNIIGAVTDQELFKHLGTMGQVGFLSRMVLFSYSYTQDQVKKVFEAIMDRRNTLERKMLKLRKPRKIQLERKYAERLRPIVDQLALRLSSMIGESMYGFRYQRNLQTLACASAFLEGHEAVMEKDVKEIEHLSHWFNFDLNPIE